MASVSVWHCVLAPFLVHRDRIPDGSQVGEEGFAVAPQGRHGGIPGIHGDALGFGRSGSREKGFTYEHTPISLSVGNPLPSAWPHLPKAVQLPQTASSAGGKISHP